MIPTTLVLITIDLDQQTALFSATLIIAVVIWYTWLVFRYYSKKQQQSPLPPGPQGLPIVGYLPFLDSQLHSHFALLAKKYGPILSLRLGGETCIVISSPGMAREILKDNDVTFANRPVPNVVKAMEYGGRDLVFTPYGAEWRMLRKVCMQDMLGHATLNQFYCYRRREIGETVRYLHSLKGLEAVNVGEEMFLSILNVITSMLWGGTIQGDKRSSIGAELRQVVGEITDLMGKPNVSDFFPRLEWMDLQGMKKRMKKVVVKLERIFDEIIGLRTEGDGKKSSSSNGNVDFLQVLLKLREGDSTKPPLTMFHVKALLLDMVVGGTDTTSSTVEFAIAEMMNNPRVMIKAQQELDAVVGKAVEESDLDKLIYLKAVIKEVLRLHPVLPLMVPHCPSESCTVAGFRVPRGARVFVNVWAIHRDPAFWEQPSEFMPERFLGPEGEGRWDYSGSDLRYLPFGSGRRRCAGMDMGERIVMLSVASLVHGFDWSKLGQAETVEEHPVSEKFGIVLKKREPLVAVPVPRLTLTD
ncbi:flavonoid 3'-monooxygenase-like [Andrographis paniculata]|uniref:flavonoid 3'-monooxygenase-like n=1 Tax=Andrographis paniculata TaxID=175694 RepID=UPI0021E8C732|nr:flavonoid 3'-monooxygenase-like [Andrographis paniculata]